MAEAANRLERSRGGVEKLSSGALRVKVSAGFDPITECRHSLAEVVPAGSGAHPEPGKVSPPPLHDVDERRESLRRATVERLPKRYFDEAYSTKATYRRCARSHVLPFIGRVEVGRLDVDTSVSSYAESRRSRGHSSRNSVRRANCAGVLP